jgi:hypothetical protein
MYEGLVKGRNHNYFDALLFELGYKVGKIYLKKIYGFWHDMLVSAPSAPKIQKISFRRKR